MSCWIRVREIQCHSANSKQLLEHTVDMTEPCSKWTHLLQVLQPLQLQLGLQENKKAQECNMLLVFFLFFAVNRKTLGKRREKGEVIELQCFSDGFKDVS